MGSLTAEIPPSAAGTKSKHGGVDTLESEAIGLDVAVRVHGSQVTAVVLDTTEHVEPFEEDTSTMIVFPRGAVVKLRARVRSGHAVVLTNLSTKQTALSRIIQVNSTASAVHYVKLEFSQPEPGFWGIHFPSDDAAPAPPLQREARETNPAAPPAARTTEPPEAPAQKTPSAERLVEKAQPSSEVDLPQPESRPAVREAAREVTEPALNYGASSDTHAKIEVVPLAATPTKQAPAAPKSQAIIARPPQVHASSAADPAVFDSLSTGEEIFGKDAPAASVGESILRNANSRTMQGFGRSLDPSSLLQSVEIPKRHTGLKIFLSAAAVVIIGAGAVFYVKQYRGNARQNAIVPAFASAAQKSPSAASNTAPPETNAQSPAPANTEEVSTSAATPSASHAAAPAVQPPAESDITVTPVHNASRNAASQSSPAISTGLANVYVGDLAARPQVGQRARVPVQAPVPAISSAPGNFGATSSSAALGSLVGGASVDNPALPKPAEPKSLTRGGVVTPPRLIRNVQPEYPPLATANRIEGDVQIEASIDQTGKVIATKVISGPILLRRAAMDAVKQWRYSPALLDGQPIPMQYKVTVSFHLGQ